MKPTPTPWHLDGQDILFICDSYNNKICELYGGYQYKDHEIRKQEKADGKFIIKAVEFYIANHKGDTK